MSLLFLIRGVFCAKICIQSRRYNVDGWVQYLLRWLFSLAVVAARNG